MSSRVCVFVSFLCFIFLCCCFFYLLAWFLKREKKGVELDGWKSMENIGGNESRETNLNILYKIIFNKH